ncbi:hypothetical protein M758_N017800 [Ceratodon purpureus]|nr:hypothetical protein M758_N017800 [Ceratodon purpureus]
MQQLRAAVRPPLSVGGAVHRAEELPVLLHVRVVDVVAVHLRVFDVRAVHKDFDGRWGPHGVAGAVSVSGSHRADGVHVHMRVVCGRADGVPSVPDRYKPDDVRELPVPVRQQGEPLQPRVHEQLRGDILQQDPGFEEPVQEQGRGDDSGGAGGGAAESGDGGGGGEGAGRGAGVQGDVAERGRDGGRGGRGGDGGGPGEHGERAGDGDEGRVRDASGGAGASGGGAPAAVELGAEERELGDHAGHSGDVVVRGGRAGAGARAQRARARARAKWGDNASRQSVRESVGEAGVGCIEGVEGLEWGRVERGVLRCRRGTPWRVLGGMGWDALCRISCMDTLSERGWVMFGEGEWRAWCRRRAWRRRAWSMREHGQAAWSGWARRRAAGDRAMVRWECAARRLSVFVFNTGAGRAWCGVGTPWWVGGCARAFFNLWWLHW